MTTYFQHEILSRQFGAVEWVEYNRRRSLYIYIKYRYMIQNKQQYASHTGEKATLALSSSRRLSSFLVHM